MNNAKEKHIARLRQWAARKELYRRNFELFAREQIRIRGAAPGQILTLDIAKKPAQQILHAKCQEQLQAKGYIRVRALKARQQGFSTYSEGRGLHGSGLNRNYNSLLIANDKETTQTIFRIARFAYDSLAPAIRPLARYDSKSELVFENPDPKTRPSNPGLNSRMTFVQAKELAGTGTTIHFLHTSETSKWPEKATEMLETSLMPALHYLPGTVHIDESTAYTRLGDYFRAKCEDTRDGKDGYGWVMVPWWLEPMYSIPLQKNEVFRRTEEERAIVALAKAGQPDDGVPKWDITKEQLNWRRTLINSRGQDGDRLFLQEYLQDFDSSWVTFDVNVFPLAALNRQKANLCMPRYAAHLEPSHINNYSPEKVILKPPVEQFIGADANYVAVWRLPEKSHQYSMGIDVALGQTGGNWTVFEVFDMVTHEQCAEAHLHVDPDDAGWLAFTLGMFYNRAQINTELTGPGYNTDARLKKNLYPNLYIWRSRDRIAPKLTNFTGWKTTPESKKFLIGMATPLFNRDQITIHSRVLLDELRHFVVVPGFMQDSFYAETGDDDCVMAMLFALVVAFDENYLDDIMLDGPARIMDPAQERAMRNALIAESMERGAWQVDNREFGDNPDMEVLDNLVGSLKGYD